MKVRLKDRSGIASIMDAFMFLLAMIALSSFLLASNGEPEGMEDGKSQELVDRAHAVLMSITIKVPVNGIEQGRAPSVELTSLVQPVGDGGGMALPAWAMAEARRVISELLGSGWGFEWKVEANGVESVLVLQGGTVGEGEVFASTIEGGGGGGVRYVLMAWSE